MAASVLVVSNPEDREQLLELLRQAGVADVLARDGSDDTLALCARIRPDVLLVCADLRSGDARAFIEAVRDLDRARAPRVVLIGESDGPLRTPLDVTDIQIDHFLSQPLSPRALIYAVRSALTLAAELAGARAMDAGDEETGAPSGASGGAPSSASSSALGGAPGAASGRAPTSREPYSDQPDQELAALDDLGDLGWRARAPAGPHAGDAGEDEDGAGETEAQPAAEDSTEFVLSESPAAPAWRERTMILAGDGAPDDAADPGPIFDPGAEAEWQHSEDSVSGILVGPIVVSPVVRELTPLPEPVPFIEEEPREFEEFDLQIEEDLGAELKAELAEPLEPAHGDAAGAEAARAPHPSDRTFASELQRKMSAMEERLFARESRGPAVPGTAPGVGPRKAARPVVPEAARPAPWPVVPEPRPAAGPKQAARSEAVRPAPWPVVPEPAPVAVPEAAPAAVSPVASSGASSGTSGAGVDHGTIRRGHSDAAVLLERMYRERFTGRVTLRQRQVEKSIVFDHGRPIFATSNQPEDRLVKLLARAGKISDAQAAESDRRMTATGKRMGEVLVELGFLKRRELQPAVRHQLEEIIYSLFSWDQGEYAVVPGAFAAAERIRLSAHPATMVIEGVRRKYRVEVFEALVGPPDSAIEILEPAQRDTLMNVAELSAAERAIVLGFDGRRTIAELAGHVRPGRLTVYQLAYALCAFGVARVRRPGDPGDTDAVSGAAAAGGAESGPEGGPGGGIDGESAADLDIDRKRIQARHALVEDADYFAILGVRRDATGFEIQRAYEAACRDYAPAELAPLLRQELQRELADIRDVLDEAYLVLRDDALRSAYLTHLPA